jgi:hypothetical protein
MIVLSTSVMLGIWAIPPREMFFEWGFAQLRLDCPLTPEEYSYGKKVEEILYPKYKSRNQEWTAGHSCGWGESI